MWRSRHAEPATTVSVPVQAPIPPEAHSQQPMFRRFVYEPWLAWSTPGHQHKEGRGWAGVKCLPCRRISHTAILHPRQALAGRRHAQGTLIRIPIVRHHVEAPRGGGTSGGQEHNG
jgi:hypothetical protein